MKFTMTRAHAGGVIAGTALVKKRSSEMKLRGMANYRDRERERGGGGGKVDLLRCSVAVIKRYVKLFE